MCTWIWFSEIKYSQLKINHLNDTPSTKAAGGGIYSGVIIKDVKVPVKVRRTLSSVGTSSSNIYFNCLLASRMNVEDFVDAKCRCNLVNWESIAGSPVHIFQDWNNLRRTNIIFKIGIICIKQT